MSGIDAHRGVGRGGPRDKGDEIGPRRQFFEKLVNENEFWQKFE
jgi:hypothetical protein